MISVKLCESHFGQDCSWTLSLGHIQDMTSDKVMSWM